MSASWARWQGQVINGMFPLGRYLGGSDHSGVFLTESAIHGHSQVAVKLVATAQAVAQSRLALWKKLSALTHPHLLGLFECGGCQLDGTPYLYVVMEYAEQTLAQLLTSRALTDDEVREMLLPILDALAVLHGQNLLQGQLKPSNILVVGDQLKLASDTILRVGESAASNGPPSIYDPPETRQGSASTSADIWALGVTLTEALTLRPPQGLSGGRKAAVLPPDFSPAFRKIVARCLNTTPQSRPSVAEFMAWVGGPKMASTPTITRAPTAPKPEPKIPEPDTPTIRRAQPAPEVEQPLAVQTQPGKSPVSLFIALGAFAAIVVAWIGVHVLTGKRAPPPPEAVPVVAEAPPTAPVAPAEPVVPPVALHESIPEVPPSVLQSITGHVNVGIRVIVEPDGSVFAALEDRTGASKRLQRLAIDAAKEWTFPPVETGSRRLMQIQFDFARDGVTASAHAID